MEYIKQSMNNIWAAAGDVVMPEEVKIAEGWLVEVPPRQYWNWMQNRTDVNLAYIFQRGVPEWDISVEYLANKSFVVYNGIVYKCILTGVGKNPESQPTYWVRAFRDWSEIGQAVDNLTPAADRFVYYTGASTAALGTVTSFARSILDDTSAAAVRTTIGAQASDATLTAIAGVTTAANKLIYFTGVDTAAATDLSAFGRSLIDDADASAARTTLGLASGATTTVGTIATQNANSVSITGGSITGITDLAITDGGTGASTAEGARSNLGLGTAAVATLTESTTDDIVGKVLKVGDFGIGSSAAQISGDLNTVVRTGFYIVTSPVNGPAGVTTNLLVLGNTSGSGRTMQIAQPVNNETYYVRSQSSGTWSTWEQLYHSGNLLNIGTTAGSARTALGLGTAATAGLDNLIASTATQLLGTNSTERVRIDASGNVGIGTTAPSGGLSITGAASDTWATGSSGGLTFNGVSSGGVSTITTFLDNTSIRIGAGISEKTGIFINGQTAPGGSYVAVSAGGAERVRVDGTGLTVNNNLTQKGVSIRQYGSADSAIRVFRDIAAYTTTAASATGTLKITLPFSFTQSMITLKLKGYNYITDGYWEMNLAGYTYSVTSSWTQTSADTNGTSTPFTSVRFGHDGTRCCILLGTTSTVLSYPKVIIDELMVSFAGSTSDWSTGWSISQITDETGITVSSSPVLNANVPWGAARTLTIGGTGKSVNGNANVSWTLDEIGAVSRQSMDGFRVTSGGLDALISTGRSQTVSVSLDDLSLPGVPAGAGAGFCYHTAYEGGTGLALQTYRSLTDAGEWYRTYFGVWSDWLRVDPWGDWVDVRPYLAAPFDWDASRDGKNAFPQARVVNGKVEFRGVVRYNVTNSSTTSGVMFQNLPANLRPKYTLGGVGFSDTASPLWFGSYSWIAGGEVPYGGVPHGNVTVIMLNAPTPLTNAAIVLDQMSWFVN